MKTIINELFKKYFATTRVVKANYDGEVLTVEYSNGKTNKYIGSGNVWRELPLMQRCTSTKEQQLGRLFRYCTYYGNPYPEAH